MNDKLIRKIKVFILSRNFWFYLIPIYIITRISTWLFPVDSDHWIFYYVGSNWFKGSQLYIDVWDHKSPLIFGINGVMSVLFGDNLILHRIFITLISLCSIWLFYLVMKQLLRIIERKNIEADARIATTFYIFWSNLSQFTNSGNNTENFGIFFLLSALYCYFKFVNNNHLKWLILSGFAISFLVFLKINFVILTLPLIFDFIKRQRQNFKNLASKTFIWSLPTLLQFLLWYSYFDSYNATKLAWTTAITFNSKYLRSGWSGNLSGQSIFIAVLVIAFSFFAFAFYKIYQTKLDISTSFVTLLAGTSLFFSLILGTFYNHYYLIVIPYFCIIAGIHWKILMKSKPWLLLSIAGLVGSFLISTKQLYNQFYGYAASDYKNMTVAANYIKQNTKPNDTVIYNGYGATFYHLADRKSASRFISSSHPLIDYRENFGYNFNKLYLEDLEKNKPMYLIVNKDTKRIYDENLPIKDYFNSNYQIDSSLPGYDIYKRIK